MDLLQILTIVFGTWVFILPLFYFMHRSRLHKEIARNRNLSRRLEDAEESMFYIRQQNLRERNLRELQTRIFGSDGQFRTIELVDGTHSRGDDFTVVFRQGDKVMYKGLLHSVVSVDGRNILIAPASEQSAVQSIAPTASTPDTPFKPKRNIRINK